MRAGLLCILTLSVASSGCSTYRGVAEFNAYSNALASTAQTGGTILDQLSIAERKLYEKCSNLPKDPADCEAYDPETDNVLRVEHAPYIATAGDPPATAAFRRTINATLVYSEALNQLASGATAEVLAGKVNQLASIANSATAALPAAAGGAAVAAVPQVAAVTAGINTALTAFKPITVQIFALQTRRVFRTELLERAPHVRSALLKVRDGTPAIYRALHTQAVGETLDPLTDREKQQLLQLREMLANWIVMLNSTIEAFDVAVAATGREGSGSLDGLLASSQALAEAARDTRRNLAAARGP